MPPSRLTIHERLASLAIAQFFVVLALYTYLNNAAPLPGITEPPLPETISIQIEGAVQYPGLYELPKGTLAKELLDLALPYPEANISHIRPNSKLLRPRKIVVAERKRMTKNLSNKPAAKKNQQLKNNPL